MLQRFREVGLTRARGVWVWLRSAQARRVLRTVVAALLVAGAALFGHAHWCVFQPCTLQLHAHMLLSERSLPNTSQWEHVFREPGSRRFFQQSDALRRAVANYRAHQGPREATRVLFCGSSTGLCCWSAAHAAWPTRLTRSSL